MQGFHMYNYGSLLALMIVIGSLLGIFVLDIMQNNLAVVHHTSGP